MLERFKTFAAGLDEFYKAPYRREFARAAREEDDLFTLLVTSETLGIPNPASFYTLELMPLLYDEFHAWHTAWACPTPPWTACDAARNGTRDVLRRQRRRG